MAAVALDEVMLREPRLLTPWLAPVGPVKVATEHPLARGLERVYYIGDTAPRDLVTRQRLTPTGTKLIARSSGQLRGFGSTVGVGTTDKVNTPSYTIPLAYTVAAVFNRAGAGGGGLGRIYNSGASAFSFIAWESASTRWAISRPVTDGAGYAQYSTTSAAATGTEYLLVVSWSTDALTAPTVYVATKDSFGEATVNIITASAGAITQSGVITIGNRDDNVRDFNGSIRLVAFWNRRLFLNEARFLASDPYQFLTPA